MADAGFFKGTSADQDRRFSDKELKLLKTMKFPPEFEKKVDMKKVNMEIIRPWIAKKVTELVGFEDEVVIEYAMGLLEDPNHTTPDPKKMQINLMGFLTSSTPAFMKALWDLLLESQDSPGGVPVSMVEAKKEELRKARESDQKMRSVKGNGVVAEAAGEDEDVAEVLTMEAEGEGIIVIVAVPVADSLVRLPHDVVHHLLLHSMPAALARRLQSVGRPQDEIYPLPVILGPDLHARVGVLVPEALLPISLVAVPPAHHPLPLAAAAAAPLPSILAGLARLPLQEPDVGDHPATPSPHLDGTFFLERIEQEIAGALLPGDADIRVLIRDH
ncbi:PWI domain-containing protein [Pisolithus albus]|nr:PWI domain-containing protein [Pisolithus albus]